MDFSDPEEYKYDVKFKKPMEKYHRTVKPLKYTTIDSIRQMDYVEKLSELPDQEYETLWQCVFTLDQMKAENNEIWIIQDDEVPRRSTVKLH